MKDAPMPPRKKYAKVNIEISNICNLQCSFCPEVIRAKSLMDPALFRRVIEQVAPIAEQVCFHLMGDPLVHPRLAELVDICHEHGVPIFLVTNGVLLRDQQRTLLLHPAFRQVCFSLHSFRDNFGDQDPSVYLERVFGFTERAMVERPDLYINFRLWNLAEPRGSGAHNSDMLTRVLARFGGDAPGLGSSAGLSLADIDVRRQKSRRLKNRLYLHFDTEFTWPALALAPLGTQGTCYGLSSHFGVLVDGTVVPCCLDKEGAIPLGKIQDQSIEEILNGARARAILSGFKARKLVEALCQRCQYIERFA